MRIAYTEDGIKEFPLVIKGDVQGSVEAISSALAQMGSDEVRARVVHAAVGKCSFEGSQLQENIRTFMETILKAKPSASKGTYIKSMTLSSTMGPGVKLETTQFAAR